MNRKKLSIGVILATLCCFFAANSVWAGNVQRNRWEGVAIGIGAAILGSALINHHRYAHPAPAVVHHHRHHWSRSKAYYYNPPYPKRWRWKTRKIWIPPTYKRVWNPAHYNQNGQWVSGVWIEIVDRPGCWRKERVRVTRR